MSPKASRTTVLAALIGVTLSGCTSAPAAQSEPETPNDSPSQVTAVVETRTVTDTLVLPVVVQAGTSFDVTAPAVGSLTESTQGYLFAPQSGEEVPLTLPETATSVDVLVPSDTEIGQGTPLLRVQDSALSLVAALTPAQVLRVGQRTPTMVSAQLEGSSGPFGCELSDPRPTATDGGFALSCRLPLDVSGVVGGSGVMALLLAEREGVMTLPIEAVAGTIESGSVYLVGSDEPVQVVLGITDGVYVEIVDGLAIGDSVMIPSPTMLDG